MDSFGMQSVRGRCRKDFDRDPLAKSRSSHPMVFVCSDWILNITRTSLGWR